MTPVFLAAWIIGAAALWQESPGGQKPLGVTRNQNLQPFKDVFFAIISSPNGQATRNIIRNTWLRKFVRGGASYKFMVGSIGFPGGCCVDSDQNDIALLPFVDSYYNLTRKTEASAKWAMKNTAQKFFIKIDDDVYPDQNILAELLQRLPAEKLYMGRNQFNVKPLFLDATEAEMKQFKYHVDPKFAISRKVYNHTEYPNYAEGPMYILSRDALEIVGNHFDPHRLDEDTFPFEDVNTGILLREQGVNPTSFETLNVKGGKDFMLSDHSKQLKWPKAACLQSVVAYHAITPEMMLRLSEAEEKRGSMGTKKILCRM